MVTSDPIADMLTRIRNANQVGHEKVEIPGSNMKRAIAEILKREGFVRDAEFIADDKQGVIRLFLKYGKGSRTRDHRPEAHQQARAARVRQPRQHSARSRWSWRCDSVDIQGDYDGSEKLASSASAAKCSATFGNRVRPEV